MLIRHQKEVVRLNIAHPADDVFTYGIPSSIENEVQTFELRIIILLLISLNNQKLLNTIFTPPSLGKIYFSNLFTCILEK